MPVWRLYVFILVIIVMTVSFAYIRIKGPVSQATNTIPAPIEQSVIEDVELFIKANPTFYAGAQNGDITRRFENRLELYRPSENRVIRSVPIGN